METGLNRHCSGGHTLLELLLVVTISGALTATGGYMLQTLMLRQQGNAVNEAGAIRYAAMIASVQFAYDKRCLDPFSVIPWMHIETGPGDEWYPLHRLEMAIIEDDHRITWRWDAPESVPVLINIPTTSFLSHQRPGSITFKFPTANVPQFQAGIAIEGFRETVLLKE